MRLNYFAGILTLLLLPFLAQAKVKSLADLPYHPDEVNSQPTLYNEGNSAFAIDSITQNQIYVTGSFEHDYGHKKNEPGQWQKHNVLSFSDIKDPYQGIFYKLKPDVQNLDFLFGANTSVKNDYAYFNGGGDNPRQTEIAGKLLASGKYENFYFGGFFLAQNFNVSEEYNGKDLEGYNDGFGDKIKGKGSNTFTNYYYQVSLGYQLNSDFKMGLSFDNIFNLNSQKNKSTLTEDEVSGDILIPYMVLDQTKTSLYRFDFSGTETAGFLSAGMNSNYFSQEIIKDFSIYHFSFSTDYHLKLMKVLIKLDYYSLNYNTDFNVLWNNSSTIAFDGSAPLGYSKKGDFKNLYYKIILTPKEIQISSSNKWFSQIIISGLLYSKLSETIINKATPTNQISQEISFNQQKIDLIIGNQKNNNEFWVYTGLILNKAYFSGYNANFGMNYYSWMITPVYPSGTTIQNTKKSWTTAYGGVANRYHWKEFTFDAGLRFLHTKYSGSNIKMDTLKTTFGTSYQISQNSTLFLIYTFDFFLNFQYKDIDSFNPPPSNDNTKLSGHSYNHEIQAGYKYLF